MANKPVGSLNPHGGPILRSKIVANTITIAENDYVIASSGFVALGTTGTLLVGVVAGIVDDSGEVMTTTGAAGAAIGYFSGTFATASDNQTVAKVSALCNISKETLYSLDPDATIGTTTGSNLFGYRTDILDEDDGSESSAVTTTAQLFIWGLDPADSGNQLVNVMESVVFGV